MYDGFLGFRGSLMLDLVAVAMLAVLPLLAWSIYLVKVQRRYALHKRIQIALGAVLLVTVLLFEIDIRLYGWRQRAVDSPFYDNALFPVLMIHLAIAVSTTVLWGWVVVQAVRKFPSPPQPNDYSRRHIRLAWLAALGMFLTGLTGWIFYYMAFVA